MTSDSPGFVRLTRAFKASAERVFDAWRSPDTLARWLFPGADQPVTLVETTDRANGSIHSLSWRAGRAGRHTVEYLEIQRPHRLSLTIRSSASAEAARVTVLIEPRHPGCFVTLTSRIERKSLHALAPLVALKPCRAETVAPPRWPSLEVKAALSMGVHLAMLPVLLIAMRAPPPPPAPPALATVAVEPGPASGRGASAPAPAAPAAPAPPLPASERAAAVRPAQFVPGRGTRSLLPTHAMLRENPGAAQQAARADAPAAGAPAPLPPGGGPDPAAAAPAQSSLLGATCIGTIRFSTEAVSYQAQGAVYPNYYAGQQVPVRARFFRDGDGRPWVRFTLWPGAPWDLPVTLTGGEVRFTGVNGSGYALRLAGDNRLTGLTGFSKSAAKIDFTCGRPDGGHPT